MEPVAVASLLGQVEGLSVKQAELQSHIMAGIDRAMVQEVRRREGQCSACSPHA